MKNLRIGNIYTLIVYDQTSEQIVYGQDVIFKNITFEKVSFLSLKTIKILNATEKISDLTMVYEYDDEEEAEYEIYIDNQTKVNYDLLINLPEDFIYPGYYYVYYDGADFAKFFLSASLDDVSEYLDELYLFFDIYPISGKNNVIIKSYYYYLPFITEIVILNNETNETITYDKSNITFVENDYIKITLPNKNGEKPTYIINTITGIN